METAALIFLRIVLAWMFLYPLKDLLADWKGTVNLVRLITPFFPNLFALLMILVMFLGSLSILFGVYAQIGASFLFIYSLVGVIVHYQLSQQIKTQSLSDEASKDDRAVLEKTKALGVAGNNTSAQKNIVVAAALLVIVLLGSGPFSLTGNLF